MEKEFGYGILKPLVGRGFFPIEFRGDLANRDGPFSSMV
jgi:hypothetical protein